MITSTSICIFMLSQKAWTSPQGKCSFHLYVGCFLFITSLLVTIDVLNRKVPFNHWKEAHEQSRAKEVTMKHKFFSYYLMHVAWGTPRFNEHIALDTIQKLSHQLLYQPYVLGMIPKPIIHDFFCCRRFTMKRKVLVRYAGHGSIQTSMFLLTLHIHQYHPFHKDLGKFCKDPIKGGGVQVDILFIIYSYTF